MEKEQQKPRDNEENLRFKKTNKIENKNRGSPTPKVHILKRIKNWDW